MAHKARRRQRAWKNALRLAKRSLAKHASGAKIAEVLHLTKIGDIRYVCDMQTYLGPELTERVRKFL